MNRSKLRKRPLVNALIVLATVALAITPVVRDQFRLEVSRWYLAKAANNVAYGRDVSGELAEAEKWGGDVSKLRDYWLFRGEQTQASAPEDVAQVVQQAVAQDKSNADLSLIFADQLAGKNRFKEAVEVLEAGAINGRRQDRRILNALAYFRALAGIDLDQALVDINKALEGAADAAEMRDTRAWVLYKMGRPQEAIVDADFAIEAVTGGGSSNGWIDQTLGWLQNSLAGPSEPRSPENVLSRREAGEMLWTIGTLYYHRAKILDTLGRTAEAEADFQWLRDRQLPIDDLSY